MRLAIGVEYDGTDYVGWQRQKSGPGVQALVEKALGRVAAESVETICAGRTDSGVHASAQVAHFDTLAKRSNRAWLLGTNSALPEDINAVWVRDVDERFHARFSATSRTYRYLIFNRLARSALNSRRAWWVHDTLELHPMQQAASMLIGKHDFSSFRAAGCQASTPVRTIKSLTLERNGNWVQLRITANAFLQHMVRNIAGTLVEIGKGAHPVEWISDVLACRDRRQGGVAAPPQGLTLTGVDYPAEFNVPDGNDSSLVTLR